MRFKVAKVMISLLRNHKTKLKPPLFNWVTAKKKESLSLKLSAMFLGGIWPLRAPSRTCHRPCLDWTVQRLSKFSMLPQPRTSTSQRPWTWKTTGELKIFLWVIPSLCWSNSKIYLFIWLSPKEAKTLAITTNHGQGKKPWVKLSSLRLWRAMLSLAQTCQAMSNKWVKD